VTFTEGLTDDAGSFRWEAPGRDRRRQRQVGRLVVAKGADVLVHEAQANHLVAEIGAAAAAAGRRISRPRSPKARRSL